MASIPKYACIEMAARGKRTVWKGDVRESHDEPYEENRFIKITGMGTLADVQQYREHKGWAVVAVHNFELLYKGKREEERADLAKMKAQLAMLTHSPESRLNESIRNKKAVTRTGGEHTT